jgi:hypothetical protein
VKVRDRLASLPYPVRIALLPLLVAWQVGMETLIVWMTRHSADAPSVEGIKLVYSPDDPHGDLYLRQFRAALALLRVRSPRHLRRLQRHVGVVVAVEPGRRRIQSYSPRARMLGWDQRMFETLPPEILAAELVGWAIEARLRAGGVGANRWESRRALVVLQGKIRFAEGLSGTEEFVAAWRGRLLSPQT